MATAASETPKEAEKPESARRKRWWRVPTPILVTLVGIVLSAWLFPAITRQWDDRQKAHELKVSMVAEMASATARALVAGHDAVRVRQSPGQAGRSGEEQWAIESFDIEAKLRAYFPPAIVGSWHRYRRLVSEALGASYHRGRLIRPLILGGRAQSAYDQAVLDLNGLRNAVGGDHDRFQAYGAGSGPIEAWGLLEADLARLENETARSVLSSDPRGYSTTLGDFFHDLVP
jgi:hypothetical protein